jgi:hypothetical protein
VLASADVSLENGAAVRDSFMFHYQTAVAVFPLLSETELESVRTLENG